MGRHLLLAALCCLSAQAVGAAAPASAAGCAKCHAGSGKTPALACRPAAELLPLLRRYREAGGRHRALGSLSDAALEELAAWYAGPGCSPP